MPVVVMNVPCLVQTRTGSDVYGQPTVSAPQQAKCAVLKFISSSQKTAVKADNSASRGHAQEMMVEIKVLMSKRSTIKVDDFLTLYGVTGSVTSVRPMNNVMGKLDHIEVEAVIVK